MSPQSYAIRPSRLLRSLLIVAHTLAATTVCLLPLDWPLRLVMLGLLAYSVFRELRALRQAGRLVLHWAEDGLALQDAAGQHMRVRQQGEALVTPLLVVLPLVSEDDGVRHRLVLLPDSMDEEDFRRLRVRLRWAQGA